MIAFERYPYLYNLPRAGHIDHEAMRIVQNLGGADELEKTLWEVRGDYVWINREGQLLMLQPLDEHGENALSGWYSDYTQWQPHLEDAFRNAADACGAEIHLGWEAVGLQVRDDDATLTVNRIDMRGDEQRERSEEFRTVTARYVVGADGASSFVRTTLGIPREDLGFNERWLDVDMRTLREVEFNPNIGQICDPTRPRMLMPLGQSHRRFEWMLLPGEATAEMERPEMAWRLLEEFNVTPGTHEIARQIVYTFQARVANAWRVGRAFITGDAAHTMPPFAGQGLLSSLRDSANLAWKLDYVLRGIASDALLDTYELERRPHVRDWTAISMAEGAVSCVLDEQEAAARDQRFLSGEPLPAPNFPTLATGVLSLDEDGRPVEPAGTLGLQATVRGNSGLGRLDDVAGGLCFNVLTRGGTAQSVLEDAQLAFLVELGALVLELVDSEQDLRDDSVIDVDGTYRDYFERYGIAAVVNRPDFYVFGAVSQLSELGSLVDRLRISLSTAQA